MMDDEKKMAISKPSSAAAVNKIGEKKELSPVFRGRAAPLPDKTDHFMHSEIIKLSRYADE